ncbi:MAG: hypothetical protein QF921_02820 [Pseudomonadales bacterium]|nr:hypothetical protein [Pseudomonadales bacterium]MDP6469416.1 hypothetical protein [Pseudomonadales bacterium]MDP6827258.1 hypothetical protein [Pseudomonadales bacterium]MDP6970442.1 hypothetical protein [Pseudomonadales bacterium]
MAVPGAIAAAVAGLRYIPCLRRLDRTTLVLFVVSGAMYLGSALGAELLTEPYAEEDLLDSLAYNLTTVVEEAMEMSGVILFMYALLGQVSSSAGSGGARIEVSLDGRG